MEREISVGSLSQQKSLLGTAVNVMALIATQDFVSLSSYVHPSQGARFSPYSYVDVQNHLQFEAQEIAGLPLDTVGINQVIGFGNTLVNISDVHPNGSFVEFHFTGFDSQYEGID